MSTASGRFVFAGRKGTNHPVPHGITVLVGKSTEIHNGDVLVLDVGSTYSTGSTPVARPLLSGDTITTSNGLIGVALFDMLTSSTAKVQQPNYPVTVDVKARITPQLLSIPHALPSDPNTGYTEIYIASFDPTNLFWAYTQSNDVSNFYLLNRALGIGVSAASFPANYTIDDDTAAANSPLVCEYVDTSDPQFNSANGGGRVQVSCRSQFYQRNTGGYFSS